MDKRLFLLAGILGGLLAAACGGRGRTPGIPASPASSSPPVKPLPIFLPPPPGTPRAGRPFPVRAAAGASLPGRAVSWKDLPLDYLFARQGGRQWVPDPEEGVDFPRPGEVLLGLLSRPLRVPGVQGKVVYCAKTILDVSSPPDGTAGEAPSSVTALAGFPLEIGLMVDPGGLRPGDDCPLRVSFQGDPLAGAEVRIEGETRGWGNPLLEKTDGGGGACFRLEGEGPWLVTVRHAGAGPGGEPLTWVSSLFFRVKGGER